jgi:hypothetical protein
MAITWKRSEIRAEVRLLAGIPDTSQMSDGDVNDRINDFYLNIFPGDVYVQELETFFYIDTADDDDGEYLLDDDMFTIEEPMTIKDSDNDVSTVEFYQNKDKFYELYPEDAHDEDDERQKPAAALLYGRVLFLRPKPDEVYRLKTAAKKKPAALSTDNSVPLNVEWGPAIVQGTAVLIKNRQRDFEGAQELGIVYQTLINKINGRDLVQKTQNTRAMPRW